MEFEFNRIPIWMNFFTLNTKSSHLHTYTSILQMVLLKATSQNLRYSESDGKTGQAIAI